MPTPPDHRAPTFTTHRPAAYRSTRPWHGLAYVNRVLPARIGALARSLATPAGAAVLDLGAADSPYRAAFPPGTAWTAADLPGNPAADVHLAADGTVPLPDASFDVVLSTQVLEHVEHPGTHLAEAVRLLRPGGRLLLSTHGLMAWHPDPVDLWRWTSEGLRRVVEDAGLEVEHFEGIMGKGAIGFQLVQDSCLLALPHRRLRQAWCLLMQALVALADRLQSREHRDRDACVFALVARRPA